MVCVLCDCVGLPETTVEPSDVLANVGCQVTLMCFDALSIVPSSEAAWSREGQRLEESDTVSLGVNGELILSSLKISDSGNYTCTLWSELGSVQDSVQLTVEDPLFGSGAPVAPPTITTSTPLTQSLPLGGTAQFVCFVEGFPVPELVWLRDNEPQPNLRRVDMVGGGLTVSELRITDNATYTCAASNALGTTHIDFQLLISGVSDMIVCL